MTDSEDANVNALLNPGIQSSSDRPSVEFQKIGQPKDEIDGNCSQPDTSQDITNKNSASENKSNVDKSDFDIDHNHDESENNIGGTSNISEQKHSSDSE